LLTADSSSPRPINLQKGSLMTNQEQHDLALSILATAKLAGITAAYLNSLVNEEELPTFTVSEYMPTVRASAKAGAAKTYAHYWNLMEKSLGDKYVSAVCATDLTTLTELAQSSAVSGRSNFRDGVSAKEHCVAAVRLFFHCAVADKLVRDDPASGLKKPSRLESPRMSFTNQQVADLYQVTSTGGDDPILDTLLLRFHLETGARRAGALGLQVKDLHIDSQCVRLREKNHGTRRQPISLTLQNALVEHCAARGARRPEDAVFRRIPRNGLTGMPITRRRYNTLTARWGKSLEWVKESGVSIHWCRHHAIASIEQIAGFGVARAFAGHKQNGEATTTYIRAHLYRVARAVAIYTGEAHPLECEGE
jgi:site-specific recombinase XerC